MSVLIIGIYLNEHSFWRKRKKIAGVSMVTFVSSLHPKPGRRNKQINNTYYINCSRKERWIGLFFWGSHDRITYTYLHSCDNGTHSICFVIPKNLSKGMAGIFHNFQTFFFFFDHRENRVIVNCIYSSFGVLIRKKNSQIWRCHLGL